MLNLPSRAGDQFSWWLEVNQLLEEDKRKGSDGQAAVPFVFWFPTNGGKDSIDHFVELVTRHGEGMTYVFVKNDGLCLSWDHLKQERDLTRILDFPYVYQMHFPKLNYGERNKIDRERCTFEQAIGKDSNFQILERQRIQYFVRNTSSKIDSLGLIGEPANAPSGQSDGAGQGEAARTSGAKKKGSQ